MDWIVSPSVNAQVASWFGEAPAQPKACDEKDMAEHCDDLPRRGPGLLRQHLVLDDADHVVPGRRADVKCVAYPQWTQAWTEIKG